MPPKAGKVYLVGAGPGDAGLITVRGVECLSRADVVVYDNLANDALLAHAPASSEKIFVGKSAAAHTRTQDDINKLLVEKARAGKSVVRLKGGDPFVFGRGGEEAIHLSERHIEFEVVPGVSSAVAVPAYAGIPVTQRNLNVTLHIVTGHEDPGKVEPDIDWDALARSEGTIIFLMGVGNLPRIVEELTSRGKSPETPVAVIRWGTMPEQEVLVSTLDNVCYEVTKRDFQPPAVTVIGQVVELRPLIQWVERKPLFGIRAALTRPADQGVALAAALRDAGADVVITPTIRIVPRPLTNSIREKLAEIASYDWLVFTSANGVKTFFTCLDDTGMDARALHGLKAAAIGERTAEALRSHGIRADVVPREFVQESLAKSIRVAKGDRVLVPRASAARDVLQDSLEKRGAQVTILPVYDTLPDPDGIATLRRQLTRGRIHLCTFTSASTVEKFVGSAKAEDVPKFFEEVAIASIGPVTTKALEACGLRADIEAAKSTTEGLAEAIIRHYAPRKRSARSTRS